MIKRGFSSKYGRFWLFKTKMVPNSRPHNGSHKPISNYREVMSAIRLDIPPFVVVKNGFESGYCNSDNMMHTIFIKVFNLKFSFDSSPVWTFLFTVAAPTTGEAEWPRPLHRARPPHPLRPAVRPGPLLLPDHRERLQAHRRQDPPASAERGHGERADGQTAVSVGVGQLTAPQGPVGGVQPRGEPGRAAVLQREEGAPEPAAEAAEAAASAARASQGGPGQTETPAGPQEEPQPPQSPPRGVTLGCCCCCCCRDWRTPSSDSIPHFHLKLQSCAADAQ